MMGSTRLSGEVAVIGSRGFIGRSLVNHLRKHGLTPVEAHRGDLAIGSPTRQRALRSDVIYWAASSVNPAIASVDPGLVDADLRELREFVDEVSRVNPNSRVVLLSSGGTVYGAARPPHSEQTPTAPESAYGRAKLEAEHVVRAASPANVIARLSNVYGPGQRPAPGQGVLGHWLLARYYGDPVRVYGSLESTRDYVYIDDVARALIAIAKASSDIPAVINIGTGSPSSLADLLGLMKELTAERDMRTEFHGSRDFDSSQSWLDVRLAESVLGWRAETSLREGVLAMWKWIVASESGAARRMEAVNDGSRGGRPATGL